MKRSHLTLKLIKPIFPIGNSIHYSPLNMTEKPSLTTCKTEMRVAGSALDVHSNSRDLKFLKERSLHVRTPAQHLQNTKSIVSKHKKPSITSFVKNANSLKTLKL
jgi:hypothetical protein